MAEKQRYHKVLPQFWTDEKSISWDDDTRLLALYLLTSPHRTTEGLFRLPKGYIADDLRWTPERLSEPFAKLLADGFISYDETVSVCLLRQALKHNPTDNPNQAKAAVNVIANLPKTPLLWEFQRLAERFDERLAKALAERFGKPQALTPALTLTQETDHAPAHTREAAAATDDPESVSQSVDPLADVLQHWHERVGMIGRADHDDMAWWITEGGMEPGALILAIDVMLEAGKRRWTYAKGVLRNWHNDGVHTTADATRQRDLERNKASPRDDGAALIAQAIAEDEARGLSP